MKKFYFLILSVVIICTHLTSCKKCTTCEVLDSNGNTIQEATETCGNKSKLDETRADARDKSKLIGGTYTCIDK
ncbi:MAG TPA: hypothetical protein PL185_12140 [Flavobacteriales bacterium]|nr:hypothetical protein [Flavobacteriales bacterium]